MIGLSSSQIKVNEAFFVNVNSVTFGSILKPVARKKKKKNDISRYLYLVCNILYLI